MKILFIGGDTRMDYAARALSAAHTVTPAENAVPGEKFDAVVLPLPLTKDGQTIFAPRSEKPLDFRAAAEYADKSAVIFAGGECSKLTEICAENGLRLVNYFADEALTLKNAELTAEAACALLIQSTDYALLGSRVLIVGYGRIARFLAERLKAFGAVITVAARRAEQRDLAAIEDHTAVPTEQMTELLPKFDFVINTAPAPLFGTEQFSKMRPGRVYMELASLPELPAKSKAEHCGIKFIFAPGLPGKYSPKSAGEAIAEAVQREFA